MRAEKFLPGGRFLALWSRRNAMALEDATHRLITDGQTQVGQGADDPVIAPGAVFLGHAENQGFEVLINLGSSSRLALPRAITFLGDQCAVPAENRIGFDESGNLLQGLLAQRLTDVSQCLAFAITQPEASLDLVSEDTVFRHQLFVAQQQFLIDGPRDIREQVVPIHRLSPIVVTVHIPGEYP